MDKDKLNTLVNEQFDTLLKLLEQRKIKNCNKEIEDSLRVLDYYAIQLESEFLKDILSIVKMLYDDKKKENNQ